MSAWSFPFPVVIAIIPSVLEELERLKVEQSQSDVGKRAMVALKELKALGLSGDLSKGVAIDGILMFRQVSVPLKATGILSSWGLHSDDPPLRFAIELKFQKLNSGVSIMTPRKSLQDKAKVEGIVAIDPEVLWPELPRGGV